MTYGGPELRGDLPGGPLTPPTADRGSRILAPLKAEGGKGVLIAVVSTVVFFAVVIVAVLNSSGWPEIKRAFFNGDIFAGSLPKIVEAFRRNVFIFVAAEILVLTWALILAVLRSLTGPVFFPLRLLATGYVDLFRAVPTILVILLLGFGAPALRLQGIPRSDTFWAVIALTLVYSAYVAEVYRAGIESVHPSQVASARALGLSRRKTLRFVVIPQAVRRVIPPLLNDFIGLQKDSALVVVLGGVVEGLRQAQVIVAATFNFTPYVALALVYVVITIPQARFVDWLVARDRRRRQAAGGV
ncbi:MAG TPA: amino acid ABC transporter permease [Actinomycetota bacterium]|nr:amino acid ABC transporter permease [Actinomycetota bacterium]